MRQTFIVFGTKAWVEALQKPLVNQGIAIDILTWSRNGREEQTVICTEDQLTAMGLVKTVHYEEKA